jgi:hypothetical protein
MSEEHKTIAWDDVDWHNTHIEVTVGLYHVGIVDHDDYGRCIAFSVAHDDLKTSPDPQIILLNEDALDDLIKALNHAGRNI